MTQRTPTRQPGGRGAAPSRARKLRRVLYGAIGLAAALVAVWIGDPEDEAARVRAEREQKIEEATQALRATGSDTRAREPEPASELIAAEPFRDAEAHAVRFVVRVQAEGQPARDAEVLFELALPPGVEAARSLRIRTDDRGAAAFDVSVESVSAAESVLAFATLPGFAPKATTREGPFRDSRCEMLLALDAGRTIRGRVVDIHGAGLGGVVVSAGYGRNSPWRDPRAVTRAPADGAGDARDLTQRLLEAAVAETDAQGRFELRQVAGSAGGSLAFRKPGFVFGMDATVEVARDADEIFVVAEPVFAGVLQVFAGDRESHEELASIRVPGHAISDSPWRVVDDDFVALASSEWPLLRRQLARPGWHLVAAKQSASVLVGELRSLQPGWQGWGAEDDPSNGVPVEIERFGEVVVEARLAVVPLDVAARSLPPTRVVFPDRKVRRLTLRAPWLRGISDGRLTVGLATIDGSVVQDGAGWSAQSVDMKDGRGSLLLPEDDYALIPHRACRNGHVAPFELARADLSAGDAVVELRLSPDWCCIQVQPRTVGGWTVPEFEVEDGGPRWSKHAEVLGSGSNGTSFVWRRSGTSSIAILAPGFQSKTISFEVPAPASTARDGLSDIDAAFGAPRVILTPTLLPLH